MMAASRECWTPRREEPRRRGPAEGCGRASPRKSGQSSTAGARKSIVVEVGPEDRDQARLRPSRIGAEGARGTLHINAKPRPAEKAD